jgi:IS5 family transposase
MRLTNKQQRTLATMNGFERYTKKTRREGFLEEMEQVVPWRELGVLIEPHYPKPGKGRPPVGVGRMLRMYFLQQWFNLSDPAVEEALYDSPVMRQFVGIDLGQEPAPDETTVCKFRHLLEEHGLGEKILGTVNLHLQARGVRITTGTIVDATILHAPSSTKNREQQRDPESTRPKKAISGVCHEHERKLVMPYRRWETDSRSRLTGAGFKPPGAAASKRRGGERPRKRHR